MSESNQIYQLLPKVAEDIGAIGKDARNAHFKFNYRSIDQVYNAVHKALVKHGVTILPRCLNVERDKDKTFVEMEYTLSAPDGSVVTCSFPGEASDKTDKGTNKAVTAAFKYFLFECFCIPIQGTPDADAGGPAMQDRSPSGNPAPRRDGNTASHPGIQLAKQLGSKWEPVAIEFFVNNGGLKQGQKLHHLPEERAARAVKDFNAFVKALEDFAEKNDDIPM